MAILIYEDEATRHLDPVTLTRPAFAISCGGTRLIDEVQRFDQHIYLSVRQHLRDIVANDYPKTSEPPASIDEPCVCINARLVPTISQLTRLKQLTETSTVAGEFNPTSPVFKIPAGTAVDQATLKAAAPNAAEWELLDRPHDIVRHHLVALGDYLEHSVSRSRWKELQSGVFVALETEVSPSAVFDTSDGPIVIRGGANIGPFTFLQGPLLIDERAKVLAHSQVKEATHVGRLCKVGGELEASIMEPYSNKQHHGFLGHSYIGSWVNLGAGTSNSDLKNTYGEINIDYGQGKIPTGMQFLGCVIGDYAKTAINTSIYTGKVVGTASMLYETVTQSVPPFVNYARSLGSESVITPDVIIRMQQRMFARRNVPHRECDADLMQSAFEMTAASRQGLAAAPPAL